MPSGFLKIEHAQFCLSKLNVLVFEMQNLLIWVGMELTDEVPDRRKPFGLFDLRELLGAFSAIVVVKSDALEISERRKVL